MNANPNTPAMLEVKCLSSVHHPPSYVHYLSPDMFTPDQSHNTRTSVSVHKVNPPSSLDTSSIAFR